MRKLLFILFLFQALSFLAKADEVDSLLQLIKISKSDTQKVRLYGAVLNACEVGEIMKYSKPALELLNKKKLNPNAPEYLLYENEKARLYNNVGYYFYSNLNLLKSLDYYQKAILILENTKSDDDLLASLYTNITAQYIQLRSFDKAILTIRKVIVLDSKENKDRELSIDYANLATCLVNKSNYDSALVYFEKSLALRRKLKYTEGEALDLLHIGCAYLQQKKMQKANEYLTLSENKTREIKNLKDSSLFSNLYYWKGKYYYDNADYKKSKSFLDKAYQMAIKNKIYINLESILNQLYFLNKKTGNDKLALFYFERHKEVSDSTISANIAKDAELKNLKFDYDKKELLSKAENEKQIAIEKEKQTRQIYFIVFALIIIVFGAVSFVIIYNRWKLVSKQKTIIEEQKDLLATQHQDLEMTHELLHKKNITITDSINYAMSIQEALLTSEEEVKEIFGKDCFVLFKPKDVVSGDFYWVKKFGNKVIWIVADCTGHGVPGAFISLLAIKSIENYFVSESNINNPKEVMNHIHKEFLSSFEQSKETGIGVELVLCCLDLTTNILNCCGSSNAVLIANGNELTEYKFSSLQIGKTNHVIENAEEISFQLKKGDVIYLTTDGFVDQMGGPQNRKFSTKKLKELATELNTLNCKMQKEYLENSFVNWMGKKQQYDDVTLFCVKV